MFTNSFLKARLDCALILITAPRSSTWTSKKKVRRTLEQWQTKVFVGEAVRLLRLRSAFDLDVRLFEDHGEALNVQERPHLFDRMASKGEPCIARALSAPRARSRTEQWLSLLLKSTREPASVPDEPIWRLLDPEPLDHVQWAQLGEQLMRKSAADPAEFTAHEIVVGDLDDETVQALHYVPSWQEDSRWGLASVLLQMRRWEIAGDLVGYYLNLLEAVRRCTQVPSDSDVYELTDAANFLATCFGSVHISHAHAANYQYQAARLNQAREAFFNVIGAPGAVRSGRPIDLSALVRASSE